MANNPGDIPTLLDECSKLNVNLNVLKRDLQCSDNFISWLPLLTDELEKYTNITRLNLFEKVRLLVEIGKYLPKILKLKDDLTNAITSTETTENLTPKPNVNDAKPIEIETNAEEQNTNPIAEIQKQYYPSNIVNFVRSLDNCDVSTVRLRPKGDIECLLCHSKNLYSNMSNIKGHICSRRHLSKVSEDYQNLVEFHNFWQRQTPETWKNYMQFNYASDCLRCVRCCKSVKYEDVTNHLVVCSGPAAIHENSVGGKTKRGKDSVQRIVYKGVPSVKIGDGSYPIFQCLPPGKYGKGFLCLVCNEQVDGLGKRNRHAKSIRHVRRQCEKIVQDSLARYHETWNQLPLHMQFKQTNFQRGGINMKCKICPDTFLAYDVERVREHLTNVDHPSRSEIRNGLRDTWRDKFDGPTAGGSKKKNKKKKQAQKSQTSSESTFVSPKEMLPQEPANLLPTSDNNKPDLNEREHEPPQKRIRIEEGTAEPTVNRVGETTSPGYVYYDYNAPDFIPLTMDNPKVTSELVLNPTMVNTEPRCVDNDTNVVDGVNLEKN